jgi:hypothetical protein
MSRLDVHRRENAARRDLVQRHGGAEAVHHQVGFRKAVAAFDLIRHLADIQPAHPGTFGFEGSLGFAGSGLVTVEPGENRSRVETHAHLGSWSRSASSAAARPLEE